MSVSLSSPLRHRSGLHSLWRDESGAILSAELIIIMTVLVIGLVVGLASLQKSLLGELSDVSDAIGSLNQSYHYTGMSSKKAFCAGAATAGSIYVDAADNCDRSARTDVGVVPQIAPSTRVAPAPNVTPAPIAPPCGVEGNPCPTPSIEETPCESCGDLVPKTDGSHATPGTPSPAPTIRPPMHIPNEV